MFDSGEVRSACPCSFQSCSFPWYHRRGGRSWAGSVSSHLGLDWMGSRAQTLARELRASRTMTRVIACHEASQVLRFVLMLGQGQVNQKWTLRAVLRPGEGILVTCGAEVAIQVHVVLLMPPVAPSAWECCPAAAVGLSWRRALLAWDSSCRAERRCDRQGGWWIWESSSRNSPWQCEGPAGLAGVSPAGQ